jgi:L-iditol 2-dehydrogenase
MAETMLAAVLHRAHDLRMEQVPRPTLQDPDDVLVRIGAVGVCGSDVHFLERGRIGTFVVEQPVILGHEAGGTVVEVGPAVKALQPGDRVAIEPGRPCRRCEFCHRGEYNLCLDMYFLAAPPVHGAFCEYLVWPADFLFRLPGHVSLEEGAMCEPLSVGMWAAQRAGVGPGDSVAVLGAGPIGLTALQAAAFYGATTIIVTDFVASRLDAARQLGATHAIDLNVADAEAAIMELTAGRGVDVAFECAGAIPSTQQSIRITRNGGTVQLVGMPSVDSFEIPIYDLIGRELNLGGLFRYRNCYPPSIAGIAAGRIDVKSLITHRYSLAECPQAMAFARDEKERALKVVVTP